MSNLLGLGITLFPRVAERLEELDLRDKVVCFAGGRIAEKEEEHAFYEEKIQNEGASFLGVDAFFGPGTDPDGCVQWITDEISKRNLNK